MRIVAIELSNVHQRAAYCWTDTPAAPPRLLLDQPRTTLADLRKALETDIFGEPMQPADFQIITLDESLDEVRAVFVGLAVINVTRAALDTLSAWQDSAIDSTYTTVLMLARYPLIPRDFEALCVWFTAALIDPLNVSADQQTAARADFEQARRAIAVIIAGSSARALGEVATQLIDAPPKIPTVPAGAIVLQTQYAHVPLTLIDLRASPSIDVLRGRLLLVIASDPGLGQHDLALLSDANALFVLVNTHDDLRDFAEMRAYIQTTLQESLNRSPQIIEPTEIRQAVNVALEADIHAALFGWLDRWQPDEVRARVLIGDFRL